MSPSTSSCSSSSVCDSPPPSSESPPPSSASSSASNESEEISDELNLIQDNICNNNKTPVDVTMTEKNKTLKLPPEVSGGSEPQTDNNENNNTVHDKTAGGEDDKTSTDTGSTPVARRNRDNATRRRVKS